MKKKKVNQLIQAYFEVKADKKTLEEKEKTLKSEISDFASDNISEFDSEGVLSLDTGLIKIAKNPPKAVWLDTDKSLTLSEKKELAAIVPEKFIKVDLDLKKVADFGTNDKQMAQVMKARRFEIVQEPRFDIKPN